MRKTTYFILLPFFLSMSLYSQDGVVGESQNNNGIVGSSMALNDNTAGVKGIGQADRTKAAAIEAHDGAITVSKNSAIDLPADVITTVVSTWNFITSCPAGGVGSPTHTHGIGRYSNPITISNIYSDAAKSAILLTILGEREGLGVQLKSKNDGNFEVIINDFGTDSHDCNSDPLTVDIHYLIINRT